MYREYIGNQIFRWFFIQTNNVDWWLVKFFFSSIIFFTFFFCFASLLFPIPQTLLLCCLLYYPLSVYSLFQGPHISVLDSTLLLLQSQQLRNAKALLPKDVCRELDEPSAQVKLRAVGCLLFGSRVFVHQNKNKRKLPIFMWLPLASVEAAPCKWWPDWFRAHYCSCAVVVRNLRQ